MTNKDILKIALKQSAIDEQCAPEDFMKTSNVIVESRFSPHARKYLELPFVCNLVSYGNNIVASIDMKYKEIIENYINKYEAFRCFETPQMNELNEAFKAFNMEVCFMAEYFLPDLTTMQKCSCDYETRILEALDFKDLYNPINQTRTFRKCKKGTTDLRKLVMDASICGQPCSPWANALCEKRKELDILGVGAYHHNTLIGLAACSADCEDMWQIGVDVLPEMRRKGIASTLTSNLAFEILKREKVPFYCCAWSNIKSARTAIKSGFRPTWIEMTVKSKEFVDGLKG